MHIVLPSALQVTIDFHLVERNYFRENFLFLNGNYTNLLLICPSVMPCIYEYIPTNKMVLRIYRLSPTVRLPSIFIS